jgi:excisionase family DNA binding protein
MPTDTDGREWLTPKETAATLRVDVSTVYKAIQRGALPAFRLGETGALRVPRDVLRAHRRKERDG